MGGDDGAKKTAEEVNREWNCREKGWGKHTEGKL